MKLQTVLMFTVCALCGCAGVRTAGVPSPAQTGPSGGELRAGAPAAVEAPATGAGPARQEQAAAAPAEAAKAVVQDTAKALSTPPASAGVRGKDAGARAAAGTTSAAPQRAASGATGEMIALNFDDADIYEVVNALSDFLGVNFIIDQRVKGRVNIHTAGEIDKSRLLPIMETIFEMNNIAMVEYGDFYKIIPIKEAKQQVVDFSIGRELAYVPSYDRQMIQVVPLQYVAAKEIETILKRFLGPGGDVFEYPKGNLVVIIERAATIRKMLRLVNEVDIDLFAYNQVQFFKVEHANAVDVAADLEEVFMSIGIENTPEKGLGLKFIPVERIGGVLAVSSVPGVFERIGRWLEVLDTVDNEATEQVFIYFVENGKAEEIGDVLTQIYAQSMGRSTTDTSRDTQSRTRQDARNRTQKAQTTSRTQQQSRTNRRTQPMSGGTGNEKSNLLEGEVAIVVDVPTNSIIVRAIARDYEIIKRTMVQLDRIPRQVLIEVLIAEVKLTGNTQFGVEWALLSEDATLGGYKGKDQIGIMGTGTVLPDVGTLSSGFSYIFDGDRLNVFLQAQASQNKLNILSSPHILAVDNKEARIEVGDEVPIVTSEYVPQNIESDTTSTSRSIEYRSTGVILTVTPRINERGLVAMDIDQEVSKVDKNTDSGIDSPIISNRKAATSLVVQDGQTIIIGGLIVDSGNDNQSGVPFFSSIPLIGRLFGTTSAGNEKIELILLLTPHVVTNFEEVDLITNEFKEKVDNITRLINRGDSYWKAYKEEK